jgi:ABC-type glycerol-3-phosphate transport system substrate-binding protein
VKKAIITVVILAISAGIIFWKFGEAIFQKQEGVVNLTVWGLAEDEGVYKKLFDIYKLDHPNTNITFVRSSLVNYLPRLSAQLKSGSGPDIFPIHSSWIKSSLDDLSASPQPSSDFNQSYYPMISEMVVSGDKVYGIPTELDGLVMFVNLDIIKAANTPVPKTWGEFLDSSRKVTVRNSNGGVVTAGAAMGTTINVDFWPEILGLLFYQQPNGNLVVPNNRDGAEVLTFYTSFVLDPRSKTWDVNMPSSTQMFTSGHLAFYFAPIKKAADIKSQNPNLNFSVAPVPQLSNRTVGWGSFWALSVSKRSPHQKEAWELSQYLTSAKTLQAINLQRTQTGFFPRAYPRVDLASQQLNDPLLSPVVTQGSTYKSWYLTSVNGGAGMSQELTDLYKSAIDSVLQGATPENALSNIASSIRSTMAKYGVER